MAPPPPPPPMPFGPKSTSQGAKGADRNALLSQIRKGAHLKKSETNDRSAPLFNSDGNKQHFSANTASASFSSSSSSSNRSNGPMPIIPPGGLFPHGMPKLRPTAPRTADNIETPNALHRSDGSGSHSHPPSPAAHIRQSSGVHRSFTDNSGNRNFPSDLNLKGPAPAPPPSSTKPNLQDNCTGMQNKHTSVRRSVSQTNLEPKLRLARPPPNVRPPPPPKSTSALHSGIPSNVPPALPSKPPNVKRRQSFNVSDTHVTNSSDSVRFTSVKGLIVPPPPPRNNSVPNSLHQSMPNSSPTTVHVSRMSIAPPPPPPGRQSSVTRVPSIRPPAPRSRPPDPPLHSHPAPPSQMKATAPLIATPPPPPRVSSMLSSDSLTDLETRFFYKFRSLQCLPSPNMFQNLPKTYPSKIIREKSIRRLPPPPPPVNNLSVGNRQHVGHQAVLHIQLGSRVFVNNAAHC